MLEMFPPRRKDLEADVPQFNPRSRNHVFNTVVVPLPAYGVNLYMGLPIHGFVDTVPKNDGRNAGHRLAQFAARITILGVYHDQTHVAEHRGSWVPGVGIIARPG